MKDKTHNEFNERWAHYIKTNPREVWYPQLQSVLDSQIIIANRFYTQLAEEKGVEYVRKLRLQKS